MIDMSMRARFRRKVVQPIVGWLMEKSIRRWANYHMDQWEKFKFKDSYGHTVFVSISYYDDYPNSFGDLDNPEHPYEGLDTIRQE